MPAAVAVPLLVGAGSTAASLVGAKMASGAAKKAADVQAQSAREAQRFNEQVYGDQKAWLSPYMQMGTDALQRYNTQYLRGPSMADQANALTRSAQQGYGFGQQPQQAPQAQPQGGGYGFGPPRNYAPNQPLNVTGIDIGTQPAPTLNDYSAALQATRPQGGQMVTIRAPKTGETVQYPVGHPEIQRALAMGAERVQ